MVFVNATGFAPSLQGRGCFFNANGLAEDDVNEGFTELLWGLLCFCADGIKVSGH